MPITNLEFVTTHTYAYPPHEPRDPLGQTAMTMCKRNGDPCLAFLTQTGYEDEVVYLQFFEDTEIHRHDTPVDWEVIAGMGYNPLTRKIWCGNVTNDKHKVMSFDPNTGLEVTSQDLSADDTLIVGADGFGTNGFVYTRTGANRIELRSMNGMLMGSKEYTSGLRGITHSPWSWIAVNNYEHKMSVLNLFGDVIAECDGVGVDPSTLAPGEDAGGMMAIAYDYVTDVDTAPQEWLPGGVLGAPGTINHPDTPWNPVPWVRRHRIYVANNSDRTIYAGYFTEA